MTARTSVCIAGEDSLCCRLMVGIPDEPETERLAAVFRALGDPTRLRLISLIAASTNSEACVCNLVDAVGLAQSTVSHHMRQLVDVGLVRRDQRGKWAYYRIDPDVLRQVADSLLVQPYGAGGEVT